MPKQKDELASSLFVTDYFFQKFASINISSYICSSKQTSLYMKRRLTITMAMLAIATAACAQEEPKLVVKPSGRILFDGAYIKPQHQEEDLKSGVGIPDFRVGVGFNYGKWKGKVDMGYAYGKASEQCLLQQ